MGVSAMSTIAVVRTNTKPVDTSLKCSNLVVVHDSTSHQFQCLPGCLPDSIIPYYTAVSVIIHYLLYVGVY